MLQEDHLRERYDEKASKGLKSYLPSILSGSSGSDRADKTNTSAISMVTFKNLISSKQQQNGQQYEMVNQVDDQDVLETKMNTDIIDLESNDTSNHSEKSSIAISFKFETILACLSMFLALIAGASIGPVFKYMSQHGIKACLSASWRCQCMTIFLLPLAIIESRSSEQNRVEWFAYKPDLRFPVIVHVIFSGLMWAGNLLAWIVALQYTTTFKASVITCSHPLMLVVYLRLHNLPVSTLEYFGVIVAFSGLILSCVPDLIKEHTHHDASAVVISLRHQLLGIILCLISAMCEVLVLFNRITTKKYVPLMQYTTATTIVVALCATFAALILEGNDLIPEDNTDRYYLHQQQNDTSLYQNSTSTLSDESFHGVEVFCLRDNCVFGWMSHRWIAKILVFGLWIGVFCIAGFNYAMQYIAPLVFSSLSLVDPAITAILSWLLGLEGLPGLLSWLGGAVVMMGVGIISLGEHYRSHDSQEQHEDKNTENNSIENNSLREETHPSDETCKAAENTIENSDEEFEEILLLSNDIADQSNNQRGVNVVAPQ